MKIFLSSTFKDLEPYRTAVIAQLNGLDDVAVLNMENFGARPESPKEYSMQMARECDLFIGLVGHLYGHIPPGDESSITEQEYQAASDAGRNKLVFVAPDDFPVSAKLLRSDSDPEKQEAFRARVLTDVTANLAWTTPDVLANGVMQAVANWRLNHGGGATPLRRIAGVDHLAYASRCRVRWESIDLTTLAMPGALDTNVDAPRLSQVFIPQDCRRSRPAVSLPRDYLEKQGLDPTEEERLLDELRARWEEQERLPSLELLARPDVRHLVLLGDPGAGKSSLTRFVLLQLLNPARAESGWRQALDGTWPVLVELRDLLAREAEGKCGDLIGYLAYVGQTQGFGYDRAALEAQLGAHSSLFIIDGLDEVFELKRRRTMVEEILGLENRFPQMRVLVTSRIAGFHAQPFEAAGFTVATLDDLNEEQIELFADKWFSLAFPGEPEKAARSRADLLEAIERRPQLAAIAGNPLILTIMAIIARHKRLARSRTQLYEQALEVLCYAWDYRRGLELPADSPLADLQPDHTLLMLRRIAWRMQESEEGLRANAIGEDELRGILVEFFERDWHFPPPKAGRAATEMLKLLQERNWVLTTRGPQLYGFVHRTFLEYLCALELTQRFAEQAVTIDVLRDEYVLPRVEDDSYTEVIRLLCGRLPVKFADELIAAICPAPEEVMNQIGRLLLAWHALGELDPRGLVSATSSCSKAILGLYVYIERWGVGTGWLDTSAFEDAINTIEPGTWPAATIQDRAFPFSNPHFELGPRRISLALARSIWLPDDVQRRQLFALLEVGSWQERRGAIAVISSVLPPDIGVFQLVREHCEHDSSAEVRAAASRWLQRFTANPETFDVLRRRVEEDEDDTVRTVAASTLLSSHSDRSETYGIILKRAAEAGSPTARAEFLRELTLHYEGQPELFDLLRTRAERDEVGYVRSTAAWALVQVFAHEPRTEQLLEAWVENHKDEYLRAIAVSGLCRAKPKNGVLFERLMRWAQEDEGDRVRASAASALAEHFGDRPETQGMLQNMARADASPDARRAAVLGWARRLDVDIERRLLSRDLDGVAPAIDPHEVIDADRVKRATARLGKDPGTIREHYERLVREEVFPLRLSWLEGEA
jgi:hypothetical protein